MGRGRAKAKQTKVARRLKYSTPDTDLSALERELRGSEDASAAEEDSDPEEPDGYAADPTLEEDEDHDSWAPRGS